MEPIDDLKETYENGIKKYEQREDSVPDDESDSDQIEEVTSELGEPDCKLIEPFVICDDGDSVPMDVGVY